MKSFTTIIFILFLIRLPSMIFTIEIPDENNFEKDGRLIKQQWYIDSYQTRVQLQNACFQQKVYREVTKLLLQLADDTEKRINTSLTCPKKRNSELINSLLGLPKVMNDGGGK